MPVVITLTPLVLKYSVPGPRFWIIGREVLDSVGFIAPAAGEMIMISS
jgi:hypothetical protein